jgi:hypothetical protein
MSNILLGVLSPLHGLFRFASVLDESTYERLIHVEPHEFAVGYYGLPEGWHTIRAIDHPEVHKLVMQRPVITTGIWQMLQTGVSPSQENEALCQPQDPIPLLEHYRAYYRSVQHLRASPISINQAKAYIAHFYRHNPEVQGALWAVCVTDQERCVRGVGLLGLPVARMYAHGKAGERDFTIGEIVRVATDGAPNACSMLYGALTRMAKAAGFWKVITYSSDDESQRSLLASNWNRVARTGRRQWDTPSRPRKHKAIYQQGKYRWEIVLNPPVIERPLFIPSGPTQARPFDFQSTLIACLAE